VPEYQNKEKTRQRKPAAGETTAPVSGDGQAQAVSEETQDLLDEIDDVLEENAEVFVRDFIQKGGE
jgi:ubiquitin-like protein Pup